MTVFHSSEKVFSFLKSDKVTKVCLFLWKYSPKVLSKKALRANKKVSTSRWGGRARSILTNAFLEQIKNNMENLSNTKVFNVTKGCLKNLARAKNEMRAQKK